MAVDSTTVRIINRHAGERVTVELVWRGRRYFETGLLRGTDGAHLLLENASMPFKSSSAGVMSITDRHGRFFVNRGVDASHGSNPTMGEQLAGSDDPKMKARAMVTVRVPKRERWLEDESHTYIVELSVDEDGRCVARVPRLKGCVSEGRNRAEALVNIKEAAAGFIKSMADGEPVPAEDFSELAALMRE